MIGAMVVVLAAGAAVLLSRDDPEVTFCTMEGTFGTDGEIFARSTSDGCQFVDDSGDLLTSLPNGETLCYDQGTQIVPCNRPGARRAG